MKPFKSFCLCIITAFCFVGCSNQTTPINIAPKAASVMPDVRKANADVGSVVMDNVRLADKITEQKQTVMDQKIAISEAISTVEKMKGVEVTEIQRTSLVDTLKRVESRNLFLEGQNGELSTITSGQEKTLADLQSSLITVQGKVAAKESEADSLRANLITSNNELGTTKKALEKSQQQAASAQVYKNWIIGLSIGFALWLVIKYILMAYNLLMKFRI